MYGSSESKNPLGPLMEYPLTNENGSWECQPILSYNYKSTTTQNYNFTIWKSHDLLDTPKNKAHINIAIGQHH